MVVLAMAPLLGRVACEARSELDAARAARERGLGDTEVVHLGRALRWRLPLSDHDEVALARLLEIGALAEAAGDRPLALAALREVRSALLGSRALDVPHADVLGEVDGWIARLMADGDGADGDPSSEAARREELRAVTEQSRSGPMLAAAAWLAWVIASARWMLRGLDARGRLVPGVGTRSGLLALALLVAWMIAWRFA